MRHGPASCSVMPWMVGRRRVMDQNAHMAQGTDHRMIARDLAVLWHPCTQMREHPDTLPLVPIARGEGAWLIDHDGRRYLDAISSWWTNLFGHANPRIAAAIKDQLDRLEQVIFAGFTHEPAIQLAEELLRVAPGRSPSASEAMDGRETPPGRSPSAS